jgi:hypothetical protein
MAGRSEAKSAKRSFASKFLKFLFFSEFFQRRGEDKLKKNNLMNFQNIVKIYENMIKKFGNEM